MNPTIAVFGITGRTGLAALAEATLRAWPVRGLVRPTSEAPRADGLEVVRGTLDDEAAVRATLQGADAALIVFGPRPSAAPYCAAATRSVLAAMEAAGVRRLLCQTGAMLGAPVGNRSLAMEAMAGLYRRMQPTMAQDRQEQEAAVQASVLDWTLVKPPRLTDGPRTGTVQAGPTLPMGLLHSISRADLAAFLLDEAAGPRYLRQRVFVRA